MKKKFLGLGLILSGLLVIWSCSSDDKTEIPQQNETFELQLGFDLQDLGTNTKGDPVPNFLCLDEAELASKVSDYVALVKLKISGESQAEKEVQLRAIQKDGKNRLVTETLLLPLDAGQTYEIEHVKIVSKSNHSIIHYATVLPSSTVYDKYPYLNACVNNNTKTIQAKKFDKIEHMLCLHCMQNYEPKDFGFSILTPDYFKHYCISFIVDLCGEANGGSDVNRDMLGSGSYKIFRQVLAADKNKPASGDAGWTLVGEGYYGYGRPNATVAELGKICFYDDPNVANDKEWYSIQLFNTKAPLKDFYIETVPECPPYNTPLGGYVRGLPLTKMLTLLQETGHASGGIINNNIVHFWWCDVIARSCAPNLFSWPTDPKNPKDPYSWYDSDAASAPAE